MSRLKQVAVMVVLTVLLLPVIHFAQSKIKPDVWKPLRFFIGSWEGQGEGRPGVSRVEREYKLVLKNKFLQAYNKSVYEPQGGDPEGEVHEDWGLFSYDEGRGKFMFRQFHAEGYVNQYVLDSLSDDGRTFVFVTEAIENFWPNYKARETYRILNDNEFIETFELAPPDMDFELYITNHFKRKR
jgi:hypothetical protein